MSSPPTALLVTLPGCPHCPGVKRALEKLQEEGLIGTLEVVDAASQPERAQALGVRSVPWLRLGPFRFEGQLTPDELRRWAREAADPEGLRRYFVEMLKTGRRDKVEAIIREEPARAALLAALVTDPEAAMAVRLGIGAVLEEFQGTDFARAMVAPLVAALPGAQPRDRADIAHFLSLIGGPEARAALARLVDDPDPEVREIAREATGGP
ncbi:MAG: thioredoxin family protein [Burkholderiales bacterium]